MLTRILSALLLTMTFTSSCFAFANTTITNVSKKEVTDFLVNRFARNAPNWILESANEYGVNYVVASPLRNAFGMQVGSQQNKISFVATQSGNDVILTVNEAATSFSNFGGTYVQAINDNAAHQRLVNNVRQNFNDFYLFGFDIEPKKRDGGYVVKSVGEGSPFYDAGIKTGDIITTYNGIKVTKLKNEFIYGTCFDKFRQTTATFVIKRNDIPKTYKVTSKLHKTNYKNPEAQKSEEKKG